MAKCPKCGVVMADQRDDADDVVCTLTGGVECLRRQLATAQAEIKRLREIVKEWPRTADGVLVRRGMKVHAYDPAGYLQGYDVQGMALNTDSSCPSRAYVPFSMTYSTQEAAWAAEEKA